MQFSKSLITFLAIAGCAEAFVGPTSFSRGSTSLQNLLKSENVVEDFMAGLEKSGYAPGKADTEFARRFGHLAGKPVKTVGEAFAEFTAELGYSVNALYKNYITDIVATTHLIAVNARFERDPIWSLGIIASLELMLKNYPEQEIADKIVSALFKAIDMDEETVRSEAAAMLEWAEGKSLADLEAAMSGEGDSEVAKTAIKAKEDQFWLYSRYFGVGLVKLMEKAGVEMDKDEVYPIMEDYMSNKLGKSHISACRDSDLFFSVKDKLDMMETLMKEIEIREKKRMAERLERKAEAALQAAEKEASRAAEEAAEEAKVDA